MIKYTKLKDIPRQPTYKRGNGVYSDVIYTLDIETTSAFVRDGKVEPFNVKNSPDYYKDFDKYAVMYMGMFGIEDTVYYFRKWSEFNTILKKISNPRITKIIYDHNLAFEFQFLRSLFEKYNYTVSKMIARESRKPITFFIEELNIIFRCSLCLTNLSLELSAKRYNKKYFKLSGDLDYNVIRGYSTELTEQELGYCENDITTLFEIIYRFRKEYEHVERIPLTQTGEVRRAFKEYTSIYYKRDVHTLIPRTGEIFLLLMGAFCGGLTHSNYIRTGNIYNDVMSYDISSSYPTALMWRYPMTPFRQIRNKDFLLYNNGAFALLMCVRFTNLHCRYLNSYIPSFKCKTLQGAVLDNGRVISADVCEIIITDIDYDIITSSYDIDDMEFISIYASQYKYLPKEFITFMLELYKDKTVLKGVKGQEAFQMKQKQRLNSIFGCCCTNVIKQDVNYYNGEWQPHNKLTVEYVNEKLEEQRKSKSTIFAYQWGVWCTAYARKSLYLTLTGRDMDFNTVDKTMDFDTLYYDTDSIKFIHGDQHKAIFDNYNKWVVSQLTETIEKYDLSPDSISPLDKNCNPHTLGVFELDGEYTEFITLGSKRYAYRTKDGKLHTTIAGVSSKTGVNALHDDIMNFKRGLEFDYSTAGKLISNYNDNQDVIYIEDEQGHRDKYTDKYGVNLQPTTYTLCVDNLYDMLLQWANEIKSVGKIIKGVND